MVISTMQVFNSPCDGQRHHHFGDSFPKRYHDFLDTFVLIATRRRYGHFDHTFVGIMISIIP